MKNEKEDRKVGVVIPVYNAEQYIEKCIDSVVNQSYKNIVIAIVNDGSTDNTWKIIQKCMSHNASVIRGIDSDNRGVMQARRTCINQLKDCDYITFLDSDDFFCDQYIIEKCVYEFEHNGADMVCFNMLRGKHTIFCISEKIQLTREQAMRNMLIQKYLDGNMCCAIYKYSYVLSRFRVRECNNDDFLNKAAFINVCDKIIILPEIGYYYNFNPYSQTHRKVEESDYMYFKHAHSFCCSIRKRFPQYQKECDFFEANVLLWFVMQLSLHDECKRYAIYETALAEFRKRGMIYIRNPYFNFKSRAGYIFLKLHIFKIAYRLYQEVREV